MLVVCLVVSLMLFRVFLHPGALLSAAGELNVYSSVNFLLLFSYEAGGWKEWIVQWCLPLHSGW